MCVIWNFSGWSWYISISIWITAPAPAPEQGDISKLNEHLEVVIKCALVLRSASLNLDLAYRSRTRTLSWKIIPWFLSSEAPLAIKEGRHIERSEHTDRYHIIANINNRQSERWGGLTSNGEKMKVKIHRVLYLILFHWSIAELHLYSSFQGYPTWSHIGRWP